MARTSRRELSRVVARVSLGITLAVLPGGCDLTGGGAPRAGYYLVAATGIPSEGRTIVGFNDDGDFAGYDAQGAFRYRGGILQRLATIADAQLTLASGMNAAGDVIGVAQAPSGNRALKWRATESQFVEPPAYVNRRPTDINDVGDVILESGIYSLSEARDTALIIWTAGGIESVRIPAHVRTAGLVYPGHLNDSRDIGAQAMVSHLGTFAVVVRSSGVSAVDCPGGTGQRSEQVLALNDSGAYVITTGTTQCAVLPPDGMLTLRFTVAHRGLNNNGRMIGFMPGSSGDHIPVIAVRDSVAEPVDRLFKSRGDAQDWEILTFLAINDRDEILADAVRAGVREFVILKPRE